MAKNNKSKSITYEDCVKLGQSREDLEFDMSLEEFREVMDGRGSTRPSHVKIRWRCTKNPDHYWYTTYRHIKHSKTGCPQCRRGITYEDCVRLAQSRGDLEFDMTPEEFEAIMEDRGSTSPSHVKIRWRCIKNPDHTWYARYNDIRKGGGCPNCHIKAPITFEDCVKLGQSRGDLEFDMTPEEFGATMDDRGSTAPSKLNLRWRCKKNPNHIWYASYSSINSFKSGCPHCYGRIAITYKDCVRLGQSRDDLDFDMTRTEFKVIMDNRGPTTPSLVKLRWRCKINSTHVWYARYNSINSSHGCPFCGERAKLIGSYAQYIIEYLSLKYLRLKNCRSSHETRVDPVEKYRADLIIIRDSNFERNIEVHQNNVQIPIYITQISIDFTFSLDLDNLLDKCFKTYQNEERYLLIVLIREQIGVSAWKIQQLIQDTDNIDFKEHIKIINFEEYLGFLGLPSGLGNWRPLSKAEKEIVSKLHGVKKLGMDSFKSDKLFAKLMKLSSYYLGLF